ncbi:hypothetical protein GCM10029992_56380 [Glycomyces albus]
MSQTEPGTDALTARSSRVVAARKLQRRRGREKAGRFLAEGPQAVREAIESGAAEDLFYTIDADARHDELIDAAAAAGVYLHPATDEALASLAETVTPQGLVATCRFLEQRLLPRRTWSRSCTASPTRATPGRSCAPPTRPGPTAWCSAPTRSTRTTASACAPRPGACSTCR